VSWVVGADGSPFGVANLPYGVFDRGDGTPTIGVRIGDFVVDLAAAEAADVVDGGGTLGEPTLNAFMALGRPVWDAVRSQLVRLLTLDQHRGSIEPFLVSLAGCTMRLPFEVADYVDFYSSEHHASNVGQIFRPGQPPLTPNWKHLPIGYHGRAGTVVVSGTPIVRPSGQRKAPDAAVPSYGPSIRLDIEAEVGFVVGVPTPLGTRVAADALADYVFGVVLVNDWSARDLQAWEYVPLGPFLGKSFATSISPWIVPLAALDHARVPAPVQDPPVLPYLAEAERSGLDLRMQVSWNGTVVSEPPARTLYWTAAQQLAHMTCNGASLRTGDLFASGTVSGPERDQTGSFLELTWGGLEPVRLDDGSERTFLQDGDSIVISATAPGPDRTVIGFGEVSGVIQPAV
jgi:fumarylacetoacetase